MTKFLKICECGERQEIEVNGVANIHKSCVQGNCNRCGKIVGIRLGV